MVDKSSRINTAREFLGLNRNVGVLAASIFGLGLGEEMWQSFLPKYLTGLGAGLIVWLGVRHGMQVALVATLVLAAAVVAAQRIGYKEKPAKPEGYLGKSALTVFAEMDGALKRLLLSDCLVRIGEGIAATFIILYVTDVLGHSAAAFGTLYAIQMTVAIALYLPMGKLADLTGRRPMVALTFLFFALFPLAVRLSHGFGALVPAFIVGGLKEMGEPARKSLIVDLSDESQRGR